MVRFSVLLFRCSGAFRAGESHELSLAGPPACVTAPGLRRTVATNRPTIHYSCGAEERAGIPWGRDRLRDGGESEPGHRARDRGRIARRPFWLNTEGSIR